MMNFSVTALPLSLCLSLMLGIEGCGSYEGFHDERQGRVITDTTAMLERGPYDAELYVARGKAYYCRREYEKALSDFNRAIEIDSKNAEAYRLRGVTSVRYRPLPPEPGTFAITPLLHKGKREDTDKAYLLEPGLLDEEINQGFGYISKVTNEFIYPVVGYCREENNLILGFTTTRQVEEMLPPPQNQFGSAIYPVYKPTKPRVGKVGKVVDNTRYYFNVSHDAKVGYGKVNPSVKLIFDMNNTLVVINSIDTMNLDYHYDGYLGKTGSERNLRIGRTRLEKYHDLIRQYQFTKVYRDNEYPEYSIGYASKTLRAEITPCVTVDITVPIEPMSPYVIYVVDYMYTCPTG